MDGPGRNRYAIIKSSELCIQTLNTAGLMNRLWRSCFSSSNEWIAWKLKLLINTASISHRMSKSKSNATVERPDVIPISTFQCFPGSDLTLTVLPLFNCASYLYLEPWLSGLKCTKLQTAIALNAEPVTENSRRILRLWYNFDGCQKGKHLCNLQTGGYMIIGLWCIVQTNPPRETVNQSLHHPFPWSKMLTPINYLLQIKTIESQTMTTECLKKKGRSVTVPFIGSIFLFLFWSFKTAG